MAWVSRRGPVVAAFLATALLAATGSAWAGANMVRATDGYVYFNRPGADMAAHDSELRNCVETWQGGVKPTTGPVKSVVTGQGYLTEVLGALVNESMLKAWDRNRLVVNIEHCMIVRGWRLVRVPDAEGKALAALDRRALAQALTPWVGAPTPHGEIVRVWRNEGAIGESVMQASPQGARQTLLSSLAMDLAAPEPPRQVTFLPDSWLLPRNDLTPLKAAPAAIPDGSALVIVRLAGERTHVLTFEQVGDIPAGAAAKATISIGLFKAPKVGGQLDRTLAFLVPAGRWRLAANTSTFDYCLGAPAFEAKAGQVIWLGGFISGKGSLQPDMGLAPAQAYLGEGSPLAGRLQPAAWVNGSTSPCRNWHPYSLEFDGYPYEAGYVWGGAAPKAG